MTVEARKAMEHGFETFARSLESAADLSKGTIEAFVAASKIATQAADGVSAEIVAYAKKSYEDGFAVANELTACRSVHDFAETQAAFGKTSVEGFVAEANRLGDMYAAAAKDAAAPLTARFGAAVEMAKNYRA